MRTSAVSQIIVVCFLWGNLPARGAEPIKIAMTAEHWKTEAGAEFQEHKGVPSLVLTKGTAAVKDLTFRNGTIEFDVECTEMGAGIGFRQRDADSYEDFYLRPRAGCGEDPRCTQYAPQTHGALLWDLFPQYQSQAPLRDGEWNHVKLVVSGRRMNVFVNGAQSPTLQVGRLAGDALEGGVLLQAPGVFANLTVTPDAVEGLASQPVKDPTESDRRFVRHWQIAPFSALPAGQEISATDIPGHSTAWRPLAAEDGGLVNMSREFGRAKSRSVVWLKTTMRSRTQQEKATAIGWSREVWVFVNGQPVYTDKNPFQPPAARKKPDGRCSLENGSFRLPLKAGDNEVAVAVANDFYGWGLILRLDDVKGVQLAH